MQAEPLSTASMPEPKGTLERWPLPHLYVHIVDHRLSGSLVLLGDGNDVDVVVFGEGAPTRVRTAKMIAPLGEMLVRAGVIADIDLEAALSRALEAKTRLGQQLVAEHVIDKRVLLRALREQILVRLRSVAQLPKTTRYEFHSNNDLLEEGAPTGAASCDPLAALLALVRNWPDRAEIDAELGKLEGRIPRLHPNAQIDRFELDPYERSIVERLRAGGVTSYGSLLSSTLAPVEVIRALLYTLSITGHLDVDDRWPLDVEPPADPLAALRDSSLNVGVEKDRTSAVMRAVAAADDHREAAALLRAGNLEAAERLAARALQRHPTHPEYRALLGYVIGLRASPTEIFQAIEHLDEALESAPNSDRALVYRAELLRRAGRRDEAIRDYRAALSINPGNSDAARALRSSSLRPPPPPPKSSSPLPPRISSPRPSPRVQIVDAAPTAAEHAEGNARRVRLATLALAAATLVLLLYYVVALR